MSCDNCGGTDSMRATGRFRTSARRLNFRESSSASCGTVTVTAPDNGGGGSGGGDTGGGSGGGDTGGGSDGGDGSGTTLLGIAAVGAAAAAGIYFSGRDGGR